MSKNDKLAARYLLWAYQGNPFPMRLLLSPSNPRRNYMVRQLARLARRRQIACQLPGEEVLAFFEQSMGEDPDKDGSLALGALMLGMRELGRGAHERP